MWRFRYCFKGWRIFLKGTAASHYAARLLCKPHTGSGQVARGRGLHCHAWILCQQGWMAIQQSGVDIKRLMGRESGGGWRDAGAEGSRRSAVEEPSRDDVRDARNPALSRRGSVASGALRRHCGLSGPLQLPDRLKTLFHRAGKPRKSGSMAGQNGESGSRRGLITMIHFIFVYLSLQEN